MATYFLRKNETYFSLETWWGFAPKIKNHEEGLYLAQQLIPRCKGCQLCSKPVLFNGESFNILLTHDGFPVPAKICPRLNTGISVETL
ncbi:MAG: hypothetical protein WC069_04025 [Candidatus Shapirobacteria bacterium]